jgi:hypothetical protein
MAEPFELISRGMDLAAQGKFADAEKYIQRGIKGYEKQKDTEEMLQPFEDLDASISFQQQNQGNHQADWCADC